MAALNRVQCQRKLLSGSLSTALKQPSFCRSMATEAASPPSSSTSVPGISASVVLNRAPILTPTPTPFEKEYFAYQYKLSRALSNPFPQNFYFSRGSTLQQRFYMEERDRERKSFGVGFGRGKSIRLPAESGDKPLPRETEADRTNDVKSLDRAGSRNLYLLVKRKGEEAWRFPKGAIQSNEALHSAAKNRLHEECGPDMDVWVVGRQPIGVLGDAEKTFFFKAHILAGQVAKESSQVADFAWLTKQEVQERVDEQYWLGVKDMLSSL